VQIIDLGMSIQSGNVDRFFELIPLVICWFKLFNCSNYTNSCELSLQYWIRWKNRKHPVVDYLRKYFRATSEERGESAIHNLMTHVRDWNYFGDNLKTRWLESSVARVCF
jgi:hypothetical protein